ncbi:SDR family oxidoreductase [Delftia sp. HK171]|uniref:SDR family oxidoreductase n=1 Tax=Delftia sp. HK171 TaxID=1920191 RepID=UPI00163B293C|nr:SDR family NAD(P)-dependent oxidoreductase [Delftia sp. HK171]
MLKNFQDKKLAIVADASGEIGASVCLHLVKFGMHAILIDAIQLHLTATIDDVESSFIQFSADLTDPHKVRAILQRVVPPYGGIDLLFSCNPTEKGSPSALASCVSNKDEQSLPIGFSSLLTEVVPYMRGRKGAMVISHRWPACANDCNDWRTYSGDTYALNGSTNQIMRELDSGGIRFSNIHIAVDYRQYPDGRLLDISCDNLPSGIALAPADIAQAIIYLYSQPPNISLTDIFIRPLSMFLSHSRQPP